jgi:hypothetical protein
VVTVTGQILPSGGLIVLETVGVVGGVVPNDKVISDNVGLLSGRNRDAEGSEASYDQRHSHDHGKRFLESVHWCVPSFT